MNRVVVAIVVLAIVVLIASGLAHLLVLAAIAGGGFVAGVGYARSSSYLAQRRQERLKKVPRRRYLG